MCRPSKRDRSDKKKNARSHNVVRASRTISPAAAAVELVPKDGLAPLDPRELFPREAPLELDIGCGDGAYLAALAQQNPQHNFLGIDRLAGRIRSACNKIAHGQLTNARLLLADANYAVTYLLPEGSVTAFHILFPDPWPKRRHHHRRVLKKNFCCSLALALTERGVVRIATDQPDYFAEIERAFRASGSFAAVEISDEPMAVTTFERHFRNAGAAIYRLLLRKIAPPR
ncbi:MAG: tRNA (guanosine(46)-N7)-methyltransferase TrmB [Chthoniobacterales bacterium]